jgi:uncharacterized protein YkwD
MIGRPGSNVPTPPPAPSGPAGDTGRVLALTNAARARGGTCADSGYHAPSAPLAWNAALARAAQAHSEWMARTGQLTHTGADGNPGARANAAGYSWNLVGENIAEGQATPDEVVGDWLASHAGHCTNILDPGFSEIGIGLARAPDGTPYWTQIFGHPQ